MTSAFLEDGWKRSVTDEKVIAAAKSFCEGYKEFLNASKTERETVETVEEILKKNGFIPLGQAETLYPGDRVYEIHRNKAISTAIVGEKGVKEGIRLIAAHIDSPRIDLKPSPLYEEGGLVYFKTHYYGMLRKYQWVTIPLALHGSVVKKDGSTVRMRVGEKAGEPQFCVSDLLPHLARGMQAAPVDEIITGERLNVIAGSLAAQRGGRGPDPKEKTLQLLQELYGMEEEDFCSAELSFVPAYQAADVGFDRSMVGGYGQDDRVCAYPSLMAFLEQKTPENTCVLVLADKEEVGNGSVTGMDSRYFDYFVEDLAEREGVRLRDVFRRSIALSCDVTSMFDPDYRDAFDEKNVGYANAGAVLQKYSGREGKTQTSDANAEFLGWLRRIWEENQVIWQIGELGRIDLGGGGTLSKCIANRYIEVVDFGIPLLSMHSPFELAAKNDIYMFYKGVRAFLGAQRQNSGKAGNGNE